MEIAEVTDRDSLRAYLKALPKAERRAVAVRVAYRAAARVLPVAARDVLITDWARKRDLTPVGIFGAIAVSGEYAVGHPPETDAARAADAADAARAAARAARAADAADAARAAARAARAANAAYAAFAAANAARAAARAADAADAARAAAYAANAAYAADIDLWPLIRADLQGDTGSDPLWPEGVPNQVAEIWTDAKRAMQDHAADWSFWINWYERVRDGKNWHPAEVVGVLNQITKDDWDEGPAHINPKFDKVLAGYLTEDEEQVTPLASASPVDFTPSFEAYLTVMRMVGLSDTARHLSDPAIVQSYLADAQVQRELLVDFIDDMGTLQGGNYAGVLRKRADRIEKEFQRVADLTQIRAEKVLSLSQALETASKDKKAREDIGDMLSKDLERILNGLKGLCREYFGPAYATLAPLSELTLDQADQNEVIRLLEEAVAWLQGLKGSHITPLDAEGIFVFRDMLEEVRETLEFLKQATDDEFREMLESKFASQSGGFGLSFNRFFERAIEQGKGADEASKEIIKRHKQVKSLGDILKLVGSIIKWSNGSP